jgi:lipopolysaccharide/colanic/teichoic acid biosynthesis glycosyltransferase
MNHHSTMVEGGPTSGMGLVGGPAASRRGPWRNIGKRAFDLVVSALLLLLLLPVLLLIALAVRSDGGPAFYAHRRVGRGGSEFPCFKFRTMRMDADRVLEAMLHEQPALRLEWEATRKLRHDPRITRAGRVLRVASLDELPQLLNVLRGEMSLVGPRPVVRRELDQFYGAAAGAYSSVRPGITGLWQVSGRSDVGYDMRVALDLAYAQNPSLRGDLVILWRTVGAVLRCRGAV